MNDTFFSNGFGFFRYSFQRYHYTDNSAGIKNHFFAYMESGNARLVGEDTTVTLTAGDIFYIPYGYRYESYWYGEPEISFISLRFLYMPCFGGGGYPMQAFPAKGGEATLFSRLLTPISDAHIGELYTLIGSLTPRLRQCERGRGESLVERAREIITREPQLDNADVAQQCGVSTSALYAAFSRYADDTPNAWRTRVLCEQARNLLITTDIPIEEVAHRLGFSSPAYFRKILNKQYGMSPRRIRRGRQI